MPLVYSWISKIVFLRVWECGSVGVWPQVVLVSPLIIFVNSKLPAKSLNFAPHENKIDPEG